MATDLQPGVLVKQGPSGEAHYEYTHHLNPDLVGFRMWVRVYPKAKRWVVDVESVLTPTSMPTVGYMTGRWEIQGGLLLIPESAHVNDEWRDFKVAQSMYEAILTHGKKVMGMTHFVKGEDFTKELRNLALKYGLTYQPLGKGESFDLTKALRPTTMSLDVKGEPVSSGEHDYSHLLPPELIQYGITVSRAKNGSLFATVGRKVPGQPRMSWPKAVTVHGHVMGDQIEPHISELHDRKAAGAAVYGLQALMAHARNHHGVKTIKVPVHTPAAANVIKRYVGLIGAQYQGQPVPNHYAQIAKETGSYLEPYLANPPHLMSEFDVVLKSDQGEDLGKMALAFQIGKHGRQPATVYRFENDKGEGPYQGMRIDFGSDYYDNRSGQGKTPPPSIDVPVKGGHAREIPVKEALESGLSPVDTLGQPQQSLGDLTSIDPRWYPKKPLFAFARPEDAVEWFGPTAIKRMGSQGFHLRAVPAAKVWLSSSGRQVIFHPHDTYKKGDPTRIVDTSTLVPKDDWKPAKPHQVRTPFRRSEEQIWWLQDLRKDVADFTKEGDKLGSQPGGTFRDQAGNRYYFKFQHTPDHARNEILAHKLYAAAGVPSLDMRPLNLGDGRIGTGTQWVHADPLNIADPAHMSQARKLFALHAWLGNWDHHMGGNMAMRNGQIAAMDLGGALLFRARGEPKPNFGASVDEWDSLRQHDYKGFFNGMTPEELQESANMVGAVDDAQIDALVKEHGPGNDQQKARLAGILKARRQDVLRRANG